MVKPATNDPGIDGLQRQDRRLAGTRRVVTDGSGPTVDPPRPRSFVLLGTE